MSGFALGVMTRLHAVININTPVGTGAGRTNGYKHLRRPEYIPNVRVLLASLYVVEMREQLLKLGFAAADIVSFDTPQTGLSEE